MSEFIKLAHERYSCRNLTDRPVEKEKIDLIIEAGVCAPTAANRQPFRIFVAESEEAVSKVKSYCGQPFIQPAPVVFIIGADPETAWVRRIDDKNFADVDASIVATQMMLEIQDLGLATTWIGHFECDKIKEAFPEMNGYCLIAMFAVGYPSEDAQASPMHEKSKPEAELVVRY